MIFLFVVTAVTGLGLDAVDIAVQQIGKPYGWSKAGPYEFDCSGLVYYSFEQVGVSLPRIAVEQSTVGNPISIDDLTRGDLLFFGTNEDQPGSITHVGIYEAGGKMIDAMSLDGNSGIVRRDDITNSYWAPRLLFARRINPSDFQIYSQLSDNSGSIHLPPAIAYRTSVQIGQFTIPNDGKTRLIDDGRMQITARTTSQYQNCLDATSIYILITNTLDFTTSDWLVGVVIPTPPFVNNQYKTFTEKVYRQLTNFEYEPGRTYYVSLMSSCTGAESDVASDGAGKFFYGYITAK